MTQLAVLNPYPKLVRISRKTWCPSLVWAAIPFRLCMLAFDTELQELNRICTRQSDATRRAGGTICHGQILGVREWGGPLCCERPPLYRESRPHALRLKPLFSLHKTRELGWNKGQLAARRGERSHGAVLFNVFLKLFMGQSVTALRWVMWMLSAVPGLQNKFVSKRPAALLWRRWLISEGTAPHLAAAKLPSSRTKQDRGLNAETPEEIILTTFCKTSSWIEKNPLPATSVLLCIYFCTCWKIPYFTVPRG